MSLIFVICDIFGSQFFAEKMCTFSTEITNPPGFIFYQFQLIPSKWNIIYNKISHINIQFLLEVSKTSQQAPRATKCGVHGE